MPTLEVLDQRYALTDEPDLTIKRIEALEKQMTKITGDVQKDSVRIDTHQKDLY